MVANGQGRPVPPSRKAIAIPIAAVAVFVTVFGLGMRSWQVAALGLALLVLAIGLVFVPALRGGSRIYVAGTGHVVTVSEPPASSVYGRCEMQLVVEAPGLPPAAVRVLDSRVPISKWPDPGATLPIVVAVDDLRRVRVQWDDVLTHAEMADYGDEDLLEPESPDGWGRPAGPEGERGGGRGGSDTVWLSADGDEPIIPVEHPGVEPPPAVVPPPRRPNPYPHNGEATSTAVLTDPLVETPEPPGADGDVDEVAAAYPGARPGRAGSLLGVGLTLLVADLERSIAFYRDILGFHQLDAGDGNAVLASGDTRLVLRAVRDVAPVNRRVMHINLEVGDVRAMYEALRARGVRFTYGPRMVNRGERLELWAAAFKDPDGHGVALAQWHQPPRPPADAPDGRAAEAAPAGAGAARGRAGVMETGEDAAAPVPPRGPITERLNPEADPAERPEGHREARPEA